MNGVAYLHVTIVNNLEEVVPDIGDLLCTNRNGGNIFFDAIVIGGRLLQGDFASHPDIVVSISVDLTGDPVLVPLGE